MPRPFHPKERAPGTHWIGVWVDLRADPDAVVKRRDKITKLFVMQFSASSPSFVAILNVQMFFSALRSEHPSVHVPHFKNFA
jgi:hypothetical protein